MATETTARPRRSPKPQASLDDYALSIPKNLAAERFVLGCMMAWPSQCIGQVIQFVSANDFADPENAELFTMFVSLWNKRSEFDLAMLLAEIEAAGKSDRFTEWRLQELITPMPLESDAAYYAAHVKESACKRRVMTAAMQTLKDVSESDDHAIVIYERAIARMHDDKITVSDRVPNSAEALHELLEQMEKNTDGISGLATGFQMLDRLTHGLQAGEMTIIAARPSHGKTALAACMMEHIAVQKKKPVVLFSMEMPRLQVMKRFLAMAAGVNLYHLSRPMATFDKDTRDRLSSAVGELSSAPIYIVDQTGLSITEIKAKARRLQHDHGVEAVFIDYLQLMEGVGDNRQAQVASISRGVKAIARDLNVPVVALSQLNRASESENRMPRASDLRESGSLEQDADLVLLLHREVVLHRGDQEWYDANPQKINHAVLNVAKNRQGPCDTVELHFTPEFTRFTDWTGGIQ